jgi:hypothetical protein
MSFGSLILTQIITMPTASIFRTDLNDHLIPIASCRAKARNCRSAATSKSVTVSTELLVAPAYVK